MKRLFQFLAAFERLTFWKRIAFGWTMFGAFILVTIPVLYLLGPPTVETVVPDGQEYRPSGASEGYKGVEFMKKTEGGLSWDQAYDTPDTLYGISIDLMASDNNAHESAIYIGKGWDCILESEEFGCLDKQFFAFEEMKR